MAMMQQPGAEKQEPRLRDMALLRLDSPLAGIIVPGAVHHPRVELGVLPEV